AELDRNRDGKVSKEELAAYYRRNGLAPFQFGPPPQDARGRVLIQQAAALAAAAPPLPASGGNAEALNEALFKLLDTAKDGKLSKDELAAAPKLLAKLDANDDELISVSEILPGAGNGGFGGSGATVVFTADGRRAGSETSGLPFVLVNPGDPGTQLARQ